MRAETAAISYGGRGKFLRRPFTKGKIFYFSRFQDHFVFSIWTVSGVVSSTGTHCTNDARRYSKTLASHKSLDS